MKKNKRALWVSLTLFLCLTVLTVTSRHFAVLRPVLGEARELPPVIVLDAGHGGMDSGAVGVDNLLEKDVNLDIVMNLRDMLTAGGFEVVLTRDTDTSIHDKSAKGTRAQKVSDMNNRLKIINQQENTIFLSVHQNKFPEASAHGAQMFYSEANESNERLAQFMQKSFVNQLQPENTREIKPSGTELFLTHNAKGVSLMVECGFISNPEEGALLATEEYRSKVAFTIYAGLCEFLGEQAVEQLPSEPPATTTPPPENSKKAV